MTTARDRPPEEAAEDTSFARGLRVLLTIADRGEIRADELSTLLDTPLSTVYRYLRTLAGFGFVDRSGAGFRLGPRIIIGSGTTITSEELIRIASPIMRLLVEETGETTVITRRVGLSAVCLHESPSHHPLRVSLEPGTVSPLHAGASAKVLLAFAPPDILDEVLAQGLQPLTAATPDAAQLRRDLEEIVGRGVAETAGEAVTGSVSVAVPILRADGIVAALGVVGPAARCGPAWRRRVARLLTAAAHTVEGAIAAGHPG